MAAPSPAPRPTTDPTGIIPADWPAQAADTIVDTVDKVRAKTTDPAIKAARVLAYAPILLFVTPLVAILAIIFAVRIVDNYAPGHIWAIYAALAVVLLVGGLAFLRSARKAATRPA